MRRQMSFHVQMLFFALLPVLLLSSCKKGLDVHFVDGTVTLDGQPFQHVVVSFHPIEGTEGRLAFASTDEKGYYRISTLGGKSGAGATLGKYAVGFSKEIPAGRQPTEEDKVANPNWESSGKYDLDKFDELAPKKYVNPKTSGFTITVEKGKNHFNFDLLSK